MGVKDFRRTARIAYPPGPELQPVAGRRDPKNEEEPANE